MTTETRTFVGQSGTQIYDGWAGFRLGQRYELTYTRELDKIFFAATPRAGPHRGNEPGGVWAVV